MDNAETIECVLNTVDIEHNLFNEAYSFFNDAVENCRRRRGDERQIQGTVRRYYAEEQACINNVRTQMEVLSQIAINVVESIRPGATQLVQESYNQMVAMLRYHTRYLANF